MRYALICLLGRGHLLVDDGFRIMDAALTHPIAEATMGSTARVICSDDLQPAEAVGIEYFNPQTQQ